MSVQLSTQDLMNCCQGLFKLNWIGGKALSTHKIQIPTHQKNHLSGLLNPVRWHALQLIDEHANTYLSTLGDKQLARFINELAPNTGLALVNLTQQTVPDALIQQNSFTLFSIENPALHLLDTLQTSLIAQFSTKLSVHANVVEVYGQGMLIVGNPGIGKSSITLQLIKRGHCLVADDIVDIYALSSNQIVAQCPSNTVGLMHVRGLGLINVEQVYGSSKVRKETQISAIISLTTSPLVDINEDTLITPKKASQRYFDVNIPEWHLHSGVPGLAEKIETIAEGLLTPIISASIEYQLPKQG